VLGHADGSVTAIYNRYGYVKEMRAVLEHWATDLTTSESKIAALRPKPLESASAVDVEKAGRTNRVPDATKRPRPLSRTSEHSPRLQFDMFGNDSSELGVPAAEELSMRV
jgi:hypothetical protein